MPAVEEFVRNARATLGEEALRRSGSVLYSAGSTLTKGDVYILGVNPGGDPDQIRKSISESFGELASNTENAYLDEDWGWGTGQAPLQRRLQALTKCVGADLREVCASNMVFMRSRHMRGINFWSDAETCWPVHQQILEIVQPKLVITFGNSGNSPYAFLRKKLGNGASEDVVPSGHGTWSCRGFWAELEGRATYVAGFPHLSRYSPIEYGGEVRRALRDWLTQGLHNSLGRSAAL